MVLVFCGQGFLYNELAGVPAELVGLRRLDPGLGVIRVFYSRRNVVGA